jgi:hypothetical protein
MTVGAQALRDRTILGKKHQARPADLSLQEIHSSFAIAPPAAPHEQQVARARLAISSPPQLKGPFLPVQVVSIGFLEKPVAFRVFGVFGEA